MYMKTVKWLSCSTNTEESISHQIKEWAKWFGAYAKSLNMETKLESARPECDMMAACKYMAGGVHDH